MVKPSKKRSSQRSSLGTHTGLVRSGWLRSGRIHQRAGLWLLKCPLFLGPKCLSFPDVQTESNSVSDFVAKRQLLHRDGLLGTEGHAFQAGRALGSEYGKDDPVLGWHARLPWHTGISSEHLLRAAIQTQSTVQWVATGLGIDSYLHSSLAIYHFNVAKAVLGFRVIASLLQTARQTPQP